MDGILNCYKPRGKTSRDIVTAVHRRIRPAKVGHAGTLDPLAEGVLVLALGSASRLIPYLHLYPKIYVATFRLGCESASGDLECELTIHPDSPQPTLEQCRAAAAALTGAVTQVPPIYSAIKIGGRRAYEAARANQAIEMRPRVVQVDRFEVLDYAYPDLRVEIACGTGTYVRTLGVDLARSLGTVAVMTSLVRQSIGPFEAADALALEAISAGEALEPHLLPPLTAAGMLGQVNLTEDEVEEIRHGRPIRPGWLPEGSSPLGEWAGVDPEGRLRAILVRRGDAWGPRRVFPLSDARAGAD